MGIIVVSDTNIFTDLFKIGLIDAFIALPWEIHTTDMVIHELKVANDKSTANCYCNIGNLHVKMYDTTEMQSLTKFYTSQRKSSRISIQDCSVWLYAMDNGYILLTEDENLRKAAEIMDVKIRNIFYVIDNLVDKQLLSKEGAADKLKLLALLNQRLPMHEIDKRVKLWQGNQQKKGLW